MEVQAVLSAWNVVSPLKQVSHDRLALMPFQQLDSGSTCCSANYNFGLS